MDVNNTCKVLYDEKRVTHLLKGLQF